MEGDVFAVKVDGRMQLIQADRVRTPDDVKTIPSFINQERLVRGVYLNPDGSFAGIVICKRKNKFTQQYVFQDFIGIGDFYTHSYTSASSDSQTRGISPLVPAIALFKDLAKNRSTALNKAYTNNLHGIVMTRKETSEELGKDFNQFNDAFIDDGTGNVTADPNVVNDPAALDLVEMQNDSRAFDINYDATNIFDLDIGEDLKMIHKDTPGSSYIQFHKEVMREALSALDMSYELYDPSGTNFSTQRWVQLGFDEKITPARDNLKSVALQTIVWKLMTAMDEGEIDLPNGIEALNLEMLDPPMLDIQPDKQSRSEAQYLTNGTTSKTRICKAKGLDIETITRERVLEARLEMDEAQAQGVPLEYLQRKAIVDSTKDIQTRINDLEDLLGDIPDNKEDDQT